MVSAGVVLSSLDAFIVNVALPQIGRELHHPGLSGLSWVLNAYTIVFAALLVLAGRLADRSSRKLGFLLGVAVFTVGSIACGAAPTLGALVGFRAVQALGAAVLIPTSLSLVLAAYPAEKRGGAVRIWAAIGAIAAALGPVVGGLLVNASWRWAFYVNVPIGVAALIVGWRLLPDVRSDRAPRPDALGAALLTIGITSLVTSLVNGNNWGWGSARVVGLLTAAIAALAVFVWRSAGHPNPIVELDLLRARSFAFASLATLLFMTAFGAMLLSVTLWMQQAWGWSPLRTGLGLAPGPLTVPVFTIVAGRLLPRFGPGWVIAAGATVYAAGIAWWASVVGLTPHYASQVLPGMLVTGMGVGLAMPTLMSTATSALPAHRFATGSAVVNMLRQLGFAIGVAVFVAVLGSPHDPAALRAGFHHGWFVIAAIALGAGIVGASLATRTRNS